MMANLLDNPNDVGMLSLGLRLLSTPGKFGQALGTAGMGAMGDLQQAKQAQAMEQQRALQQQMLMMQVEGVKRQQAEQDRQRQRQEAVEGAYREALDGAGGMPTQAMAQGGGPTVGNAQNLQTLQAERQRRLISALSSADPEAAYKMQIPKEVKIKDYKQIRMPDGSVRYVGLGEDGRVVDTGQQPFMPLERQNMGGFLGGIDPITGKMTNLGAMTQSPDNAASVGATLRGQNMTDARAREKNKIDAAGAGKYEYKQDAQGNWMALPKEVTPNGQPIQPIPVSAPNKNTEGAKRAIAIIDSAGPIIDKATSSYVGAGVDLGARVFGKATPGAVAGSQLKALEGALMMAQPRMEGPQSDKDVMLYRQMAGQIGDATVPAAQKHAALTVIREIHGRYTGGEPQTGGASGSWDANPVKPSGWGIRALPGK